MFHSRKHLLLVGLGIATLFSCNPPAAQARFWGSFGFGSGYIPSYYDDPYYVPGVGIVIPPRLLRSPFRL